MQNRITKDTLVPLGLVITAVSTLVYGAVWVGRLSSTVQANTQAIAQSATKSEVAALDAKVEEIRLDVKELLKNE